MAAERDEASTVTPLRTQQLRARVLASASSNSSERRRHTRALSRPKVAVDTVLLSFYENELQAYLVQLARGSLRGKWAFPGGLVQGGEMLDEAARREVQLAAQLGEFHLEQLFTFGDPRRDPMAHVVSVAYLGLTAEPERAAPPSFGKYSNGRWFSVNKLPELAYDHGTVARYAIERLAAKLEYSNIACHLLPECFTMGELEVLYKTILKRPIDRRNFRRRVLASGILIARPERRLGRHRPARLYCFKQRTPQIIHML